MDFYFQWSHNKDLYTSRYLHYSNVKQYILYIVVMWLQNSLKQDTRHFLLSFNKYRSLFFTI